MTNAQTKALIDLRNHMSALVANLDVSNVKDSGYKADCVAAIQEIQDKLKSLDVALFVLDYAAYKVGE